MNLPKLTLLILVLLNITQKKINNKIKKKNT